ncbi:MAG: hypothetical protein A2X49_15080 [Lentisphaerae bacterium GWF2_52_8]|nr:MAG: hypothetical protein A2X49_15080 [Lentisphaerae bacterium GWF2_52_8]
MKTGLNIKEFALRLGVSTATISRAFSGKGRISDKTRQMIRAKAEELGYRANIHARNLILQHSETIAFFYPSLIAGEPDYFITEIMLGVSEAAAAANSPLQIHPMPNNSESHIEFYKDIILNGSIAGIIVVAGTPVSLELVKTARNGGIPYVIIGHMSGEQKSCIALQNEKGAMLAGRYFRKIGRMHPVYIGGLMDRRKREGFSAGFAPGSANEIIFDDGGSTFQHGSAAFERLYRMHPKMDCALCANDVLAIGFIRAALANGVHIPEQVAVIGFDDIKMARYHTPSLSTISLHHYEIGARTVARLRQQMAGEKNLPEEIVDCELIIRESA